MLHPELGFPCEKNKISLSFINDGAIVSEMDPDLVPHERSGVGDTKRSFTFDIFYFLILLGTSFSLKQHVYILHVSYYFSRGHTPV